MAPSSGSSRGRGGIGGQAQPLSGGGRVLEHVYLNFGAFHQAGIEQAYRGSRTGRDDGGAERGKIGDSLQAGRGIQMNIGACEMDLSDLSQIQQAIEGFQ